jgi:adenylate cyclase class 2
MRNVTEEIEKKYRLTSRQREVVLRRLAEHGAILEKTEFEENTIYTGGALEPGTSALRLRRIGKQSTLTYKQRFHTTSAIKHQREYEVEVSDAETVDEILQALGFSPALVYEKRRASWKFQAAEIAVDELPFGLFMEIEASEDEIERVEQMLEINDLEVEQKTYPTLTREHGRRVGHIVEARF